LETTALPTHTSSRGGGAVAAVPAAASAEAAEIIYGRLWVTTATRSCSC